MGNVVKILPHYTYDDYLQWEGKWEVIEGLPYAMSPAPLPSHQRLAANLSVEFGIQLKACSKCQVYQPVDYKVDDDTILQPDMLIVCGEIVKKYLDFPPALVAEVLSPSTAVKDRFTQYPIYESKGIPYYIIIDPDRQEAEIYELQQGQYHLSQRGKDIISGFSFGDCNVSIDFKEIW